jgi:histidine triad (HIT) family protein
MSDRPDCPFCAVIEGGEPSRLVLDDPDVVAFLDHRPLFPGHLLVVPRRHYVTLVDLPVDLVGPLFLAARRLAGVLPRAVGADGSFVAVNNVVSQSVPHLHVHVVPRRRKDGLKGFFWPRHPYPSDAAMHHMAEVIRAALEAVDADVDPVGNPPRERPWS